MKQTELYYVLTIALLMVALFNTYEIIKLNLSVGSPAEVPKNYVTIISCADCTSSDDIAAALKSVMSFELKTLDYTKASDLIKKYDIKQVPAIILEGNVSDSLKQLATVVDGAYVITTPAPYYDLATKKMVGEVTVTAIVKNDCEKCTDVSAIVNNVNQSVRVKNFVTIDSNSEEGKKLIAEKNISMLPALMFDSGAKVYAQLATLFENYATLEGDQYVIRQAIPPYYDIAQSRVRGIVSLTIVKDGNCSTCYDPEQYQVMLLKQMGVFVEKTQTVDVAEAKQLLSRFNIKQVPTIIIEGDISAYPALKQDWASVGTIENDAYVFRNVSVFGQPYVNVTN